MDWQVPIYDGTTQRGVLTAQRQGLRTIFHVHCPKWGEGVYKIWLQGEREALLLGTLVPEGEVFTLERSISNAMLRERGWSMARRLWWCQRARRKGQRQRGQARSGAPPRGWSCRRWRKGWHRRYER